MLPLICIKQHIVLSSWENHSKVDMEKNPSIKPCVYSHQVVKCYIAGYGEGEYFILELFLVALLILL